MTANATAWFITPRNLKPVPQDASMRSVDYVLYNNNHSSMEELNMYVYNDFSYNFLRSDEPYLLDIPRICKTTHKNVLGQHQK